MQSTTKALVVGVIAGLVLLSIVVSMDFVYVAPRTAVAYVVNDNLGNIALIPNDHHLESPRGYFAYINSQGNLVINFGNVTPNSVEVLSDVFYVKNNLNEPVKVTIYVTDPSSAKLELSLTPDPSPAPYVTFTLGPGQQVPITLILSVGQVPPGTTLHFTITVVATYNVAGGQ